MSPAPPSTGAKPSALAFQPGLGILIRDYEGEAEKPRVLALPPPLQAAGR